MLVYFSLLFSQTVHYCILNQGKIVPIRRKNNPLHLIRTKHDSILRTSLYKHNGMSFSQKEKYIHKILFPIMEKDFRTVLLVKTKKHPKRDASLFLNKRFVVYYSSIRCVAE